MSTDLSSKSIVCMDSGLFPHIAQCLATQFGKVYYHAPSQHVFSHLADAVVGDGFENIERVEEPYSLIGKVDCWCFTDIGQGDFQSYLSSIGESVWGHHGADVLERRKGLFLKELEAVGLPVAPHTVVKGMDNLRAFLRDREDVYIKISNYRGDFETAHWRNWTLDAGLLDCAAHRLGPFQNLITFYVFEALDTTIEDGVDTWWVGGEWPKRVLHAVEKKDKSLIGGLQNLSDVAEPVRRVNELFGPVLDRYGTQGPFSTEVRLVDGEPYFIDATCFSQDTEVLTDSGWKLFHAIGLWDKVCTLNPDTRQIVFQLPTGRIQYRFDGDMVLITNDKKDLELLVTPNHSVWGVPKHGTKIQEFRADGIPYSLAIPRSGQWTGVEATLHRIPAYENTWHSGKGKGLDKTCSKSEVVVPMDDWIKFLALYLSEGSKTQWTVTIAQTKYKAEVRNALEALPFKWCESEKGFTCSDVQLCAALPEGDKYDKFVPQFVKELCPRQIDLFLSAYCLGDGSIDAGNRVITTPSIKTADDLQELFLKAGSLASIRTVRFIGKVCAISGGTYTCKHDSYQVRERRLFKDFYVEGWKNARHAKYLSRVPYSGMVYDVTVPNHIIFVRRNGKACWSGNCRFGSPPSQLQTALITNLPQVIYHGSRGELIEPESDHELGAQVLITSDREKEEWLPFDMDPALRPWVKSSFACEVEGVFTIAPNPLENWAGWLVATGDTLEEVIETLKERKAMLPEGFDCDLTSLCDLLREMKSAKAEGVKIAEQVPEPAAVLET